MKNASNTQKRNVDAAWLLDSWGRKAEHSNGKKTAERVLWEGFFDDGLRSSMIFQI